MRDEISLSDLIVAGLPENISLNTVAKTGTNSFTFEVMGAATLPLDSDVTITVIVKASAANEPGLEASDPIELTLKKQAGTDPTSGAAPEITGYDVRMGAELNAIMIDYFPDAGNEVLYKVQNEAFVAPAVGDDLPTDVSTLIPMFDIFVAAGQHLGLFEVDGEGKVVKFSDIPIAEEMLPVAAPVIAEAELSVGPGSAAGSIAITYGPSNALLAVDKESPFSPFVPLIGGYHFGTESYDSGEDITEVIAGQEIRLYEVDDDNKVVKYVNITLTPDQIKQ